MFGIARGGRTRRLVSGAGALALALTLAGCGNNDGRHQGVNGNPAEKEEL
jgi:hypothetical protein